MNASSIPGHANQPEQPRKHRRRWPWVLIAALVCLVIGLVIGAGGSGGTPSRTASVTPASSSPAASQPSSQPPAPSTKPVTPTHATKIRIVVTGNVPASEFGQVDINYGSDNHTHDVTLPSLTGRIVYTVRYDPHAEYYSADVDWSGPGNAAVRIVVLSNHGAPLTVSHGDGSSSGANGGGMASAQAAPNNAAGTSWYDES